MLRFIQNGGDMMSLIKIENLIFSYFSSTKPVFDDVSFSLDTNWKTGLIGRNGIGKSTLFKLLLEQESYQGKIHKSVEFVQFPPNHLDFSKTGIELLEEWTAQEDEWKVYRELHQLKLDESIMDRKFETLSKGEQTKLLLAILFTKDNGFLLIDEPTNHLDVNGRKIVSDYLKSKKGFLLISHDRDFLDGCINHVISFNRNSIDVQSGNFTSWYENKVSKDQYEFNQNEKIKQEIERLNKAARQTKVWSNKIENTKNGVKISGIKPDKGHIGRLSSKMMQKTKNLEKRQQKSIEEKENLLKDIERKDSLFLRPLQHYKSLLVSASELSYQFGERKLFSNINFEIHQGDVIAINGANGSGKSTLIKILLGQYLDYIGQGVDETTCRTILSKLDFPKELFDTNMKLYSDGQKKKVLISISLSKPAHLYIWDEPLNYIDVISRIQIEELIKEVKPTLILIEHDQRFVNHIANKIIQI